MFVCVDIAEEFSYLDGKSPPAIKMFKIKELLINFLSQCQDVIKGIRRKTLDKLSSHFLAHTVQGCNILKRIVLLDLESVLVKIPVEIFYAQIDH